MSRLNDYLCETGFFDEDDYFTSITGHLDHDSLEFSFICSGHPPFLLIRDGQVSIHPDSAEEKNLPIPFIQGASYMSSCVQLFPGDQLLFYTDGLLEMTLKQTGQVLTPGDLARITGHIIEQPLPVSAMIRAVLDHIANLSGETVTPSLGDEKGVNTSLDDVTVLGLEIETMDNASEKLYYFSSLDHISQTIPELCRMILNKDPTPNLDHLDKRIMMVLEETLINAFKHGNQSDPKKPVRVRWQINNTLVLEIIDQGNGFDLTQQPDPTLEENILETTGRGLFIIRHFSDHVQFRKKGSHIIVSFERIKELDNREEKVFQEEPVQLWKRKLNKPV